MSWGGHREGSGRKPIDTEWYPTEVRRRCETCPTLLSRYNSGTQCNVCARKEEQQANARRVERMEPRGASIPSGRLDRLERRLS
jgi:hypothetical protein